MLLFLPAMVFVLGNVSAAQSRPDPEVLPAERAADVSKRLDSIYDPKKNETTFFLSGIFVVFDAPGRELYIAEEGKKRVIASGVIKLVVYYKFPGKTNSRPVDVIIAFNAGNAFGYEYGEHRDLTVITPNEKFEFGPMNLTGRSYEGFRPYGFIRYWETLELPLKPEEYKRIIGSKSVSMRLGDSTASLSDVQLKHLRNYASKYLD